MVNLKILRKNRHLTQEQLAKELGLTRSAISMYEIGQSEPDFSTCCRMADYFAVSMDYLLGRTDCERGWVEPPLPTAPGSHWVPVYGSIAGGTPIEMIEDVLDYEEVDADTARRGTVFALRVKGDSMEPKISDGDVVIIRQQPHVETGEIAAVAVNGDTATLKKVKWLENGGVMLIPSNPQYEPMFYSEEEVSSKPIRILGKMIELRAKF